MASTPINIDLPVGEWVDLYDKTGIPRGAIIIVNNVGDNDVYLATSPTQPAVDTKAYEVIKPRTLPMKNDGGDLAEWAFSPHQVARINVRTM